MYCKLIILIQNTSDLWISSSWGVKLVGEYISKVNERILVWINEMQF